MTRDEPLERRRDDERIVHIEDDVKEILGLLKSPETGLIVRMRAAERQVIRIQATLAAAISIISLVLAAATFFTRYHP